MKAVIMAGGDGPASAQLHHAKTHGAVAEQARAWILHGAY